MFEVDVKKLKGKMAERGYNYSSFSKECDIDRNTLRTYLKEPKKIPYKVIAKMADLLCDNYEEASNIFFTLQLSYCES